MKTMHLSLLFAVALLTACGQSDQEAAAPVAPATPEDQLRLAIESAKAGDMITVPEGKLAFDRSLTLNASGVTIRGAGMDKSILSFKGQLAGAEGLLVNASDFVIEDLAIEDSKGDALKINEGKNITVRRVRTEWTNGPATTNGAYGIYPVQTENTLIDGAIAIGASDAGIYVGQSKNVIVRNSTARLNVAGIEIENTVGADVYNNEATENTGGILVFNMPDLPITGHSTRVYDNQISGNNTANFGAPGTAVAGVPAGTGIIINANDKVEIFNNRIGDNNTGNILVSSAFSAQYKPKETAPNFDPYPENIFIYNNEMGPSGAKPDRDYLDAVRVSVFGADGSLTDVIWDGIVNTERGDAPVICVQNGESKLLNIDAGNEFKSPSTDMAKHTCELPKLPEIVLASS